MPTSNGPPVKILDGAAIRKLRDRIRGPIILPGDDAYDQARRVFNTAFDRHPALIVRPRDEADVARSILWAAEHDLPLAVRGGGHSLAGHGTGDGVLVLDLGSMRRLTIDSVRRLAHAEPGLTVGEFADRAHEKGLATSFGDSRSVGIGGLTLVGGIGYLLRRYGLAIDHLVEADLITADGRRLTASHDEHPDLFWALRGGGGNFGVVTRMTFLLHPVGTVYGGWLVLPATPQTLRDCATLAADAPNELTVILNVFRMPSLPFVPDRCWGELVVAAAVVFAGDQAVAEEVLGPFRHLGLPYFDGVAPMAYRDIFRFSRNAHIGPHGTAARTTFLDTLDDQVIDATLEYTAHATSDFAAGQLRVLGGAMSRVPRGETAFAFRDKPFLFSTLIEFEAGADPEPHVAWTEDFWAAVRPYGSGAYAGMLQDEGNARIHEAYPDPTYERLAAVKRRYDPDNRFNRNQNILPA